MSKKFERLFFIVIPLLAFIVLSALIIYQRIGVAEYKSEEANVKFIEPGAVLTTISDSADECLFIYNSAENTTSYENLTFTLNEMCVDFSEWDISGVNAFPDLAPFDVVVVAMTEGLPFVPYAETTIEWVRAGGYLLFAGVPDYSITDMFPADFGLLISEWSYIPQEVVSFQNGFFFGAEDQEFLLTQDGFDMEGGNFVLSPSATVYMSSTGPQGDSPLIWSNDTGAGRITVINYDDMYYPNSRGIFAQAYAHTVPIAVWPVINASAFFIDDFPSPVPIGTNEYIDRDYGVTVDYFYTNIWWPDIEEIGEKYGLRYTGMFIETYEDNVRMPFTRPTDLERQRYFGRMLLADGEEMALHGYNHQSLTYTGFEYKNNEDYKNWETPEDIYAAIAETHDAMASLFDGYVPGVYIPPSNVWTRETREVLVNNFPNIRVFSGLYYDDIYGNSQEFDIDDDGLINLPRVASNCIINDFDMMFILSELNLHYVNSHFMHPDDALDPDRNAEQGWEAMRDSYESLVALVTDTDIRQLTATEAAAAVQRFDNLDVEYTYTENSVDIDLGGFYDEAYLFIRLNDYIPGLVTGGELTHIDGSLYLLRADSSKVSIALQQ
jgi:hypothetical protein